MNNEDDKRIDQILAAYEKGRLANPTTKIDEELVEEVAKTAEHLKRAVQRLLKVEEQITVLQAMIVDLGERLSAQIADATVAVDCDGLFDAFDSISDSCEYCDLPGDDER